MTTKVSDQDFRKFPDEDKIEKVQNELFEAAWSGVDITPIQRDELIEGLKWILSIWNKTLASDRLADILSDPYIERLSSNDTEDRGRVLRQLDLVICFFHHYIYAFDEFMNRRFRNSVIRCGLICERILKRLAVASARTEILGLPTFEARVNRLRSELEIRSSQITDLANILQYIYRQRTRKGAHDTSAATAIIAKSCITQSPTIYMLYLEVLRDVGHRIEEEERLLELVNSTISTGTSLVVAEEGQSVKPAQVLESLFRRRYFSSPKTMAEIQLNLRELGYGFPKPTLFMTLRKSSGRGGFLLKQNRRYVQRLPPGEYYKEEIVD